MDEYEIKEKMEALWSEGVNSGGSSGEAHRHQILQPLDAYTLLRRCTGNIGEGSDQIPKTMHRENAGAASGHSFPGL